LFENVTGVVIMRVVVTIV